MDLAIVLTTIQPPTKAVINWLDQNPNVPFIVIGDEPGPKNYDDRCLFYSFEHQSKLNFKITTILPARHYSRKNIGYLIAIEKGADLIYETDDDNAPLSTWSAEKNINFEGQACTNKSWCNIYTNFSDELIWPRGLPLDKIESTPILDRTNESVKALVHQGLANGSPDVDAVWRLTQSKDIQFHKEAEPVFLEEGCWCPFNSQSTSWFKEAFALLYLPSYCSFRMTDIWRSFIAQRCLWEMESGVVFHTSEVFQLRNDHILMKDFEDEVPGYLRNNEIVNCLTDLKFNKDASPSENLLSCYESLINIEVFPKKEMRLVQAWVEDLRNINGSR